MCAKFLTLPLYIWMESYFPRKEDPRHDAEMAYFSTARDQISEIRDGILNTLVNRGTPSACEEIEKIQQALPELEWLSGELLKAKKICTEKTWNPPFPNEILSTLENSKRRFVKNADHLLNVVLEAFQRIQDKLQGETPLAPFLWDMVISKKLVMKRPKCENDFSDLIVIQLRDELANRGIILNREVEIRSNPSGIAGERTDIHIDAISTNNNNDIVKVIVEAKGCWHGELLTAMETQLVDKYLKKNAANGIYLVGWFNCPQWDEKDGRRKEADKLDLDTLRKMMNMQAEGLSTAGVTVKALVLDASLRH